MPFCISGNLDKISVSALVKFQKSFGLILSLNQFEKQQYHLIQGSLKARHDYVEIMSTFEQRELMSFVFILSQFGDVMRREAPDEFTIYKRIPYVIEWQKGNFMVPWEVLDYFAGERIFRDQNYLFALLPLLSSKEKKAWIKWLAKDCEIDSDKEISREIYKEARVKQKLFQGKSIIQEKQFPLHKLWKVGENKIMDWYYKGLTPFYFTMQEMYAQEKDPFYLQVLDEIKAGKYILKKEPEKFREKENYILVSTVEGQSFQFRETIYHWEVEKKRPTDYLFQNLQ